MDSLALFKKKFSYAVFFVIIVLLLGFIFTRGFHIILLLFAAILFGLFVSGIAELLRRFLPVSRKVSVVIVVVLFIASSVLLALLTAPTVVTQIAELRENLPGVLETVRETLRGNQIGRLILANLTNFPRLGNLNLERVTSTITNLFDVIVSLAVVIVIGLYLAFDPYTYIKGVKSIIPHEHRERFSIVLEELKNVLQTWLITRAAVMVIVGVLTIIGYSIIGLPLAFLLGILTMLLTFIPYIGYIFSLVPALLLGFAYGGLSQLIYVLIVFQVIQFLEGQLLTPIIEQRVLSVPAALSIPVQILLGAIAGILGLVLTTPILLLVIVLVKNLYSDQLNDKNRAKIIRRKKS